MGPAFGPDVLAGDGRNGLLEGFDSAIDADGSQRRRLPLRSDCHAEMAACLALDWVVNKNENNRRIAENLLDYIFFRSEAMRGPRGNPEHPAFGHVAWGMVAPAWKIANYGDDNARIVEGAIVAAACLAFLKCGDPREGFARVRCPDCRNEMFVGSRANNAAHAHRATRNGRC